MPLRISVAIACLTVCVLIVAQSLGFLPDPQAERLQRRIALCEAMAIACSLDIAGDDLDSVRVTLESMVQRNGELAFARLEQTTGRALVSVGEDDGHIAKEDIFRVPLFADGQQWGWVNVGFTTVSTTWSSWMPGGSSTWLVVFVGATTCLVVYWYLRKVLRHLDPSRVIPKRVRTTLDTFAEGLLVLDRDGHIVLANAAFAGTVNEQADDLQGRAVNTLPWVTRTEEAGDYPWTTALECGEIQTGHFVGLDVSQTANRTFMVNAAPVTDDSGNCHGVLASFDDVTEIEQRNAVLQQMLSRLKESRDQIRAQNRELQQLATRDPLTSCLNRRAFFRNTGQPIRLGDSVPAPSELYPAGYRSLQILQRRTWSRRWRRGIENRGGDLKRAAARSGRPLPLWWRGILHHPA